MPSQIPHQNSGLQKLFTGLWATDTTPLPFMENTVVRSYVLETDTGVVIMYNSPGIDAAAHEIMQLGTPTRLLLNHYHEAMYGQPRLEVPVYVHEWDRPGVEPKMQVAVDFKHRQFIGDDLEILPSCSHTVGTTFFVWDNGQQRFLFPGDAIWVDDGIWSAVILSESDRQAFLNTLTLLRGIDFGVLVPWYAHRDARSYDVVTLGEKLRQINALIDRIVAGASGPRA